MKTRVPFIIAAALITPACEKKEDSTPPPVVRTPVPEKQTRRPPITTPAPEQSRPAEPATPPSDAEVQSFLADLENLAQEVAQLAQTGAPPAKVEALQQSYTALTRRRATLMSGMNADQKKALMQKVAPSARIIGPTLMRLRLAPSIERAKRSAQPGTPPADSVLDDLNPQTTAPPPPPPAPPPQ